MSLIARIIAVAHLRPDGEARITLPDLRPACRTMLRPGRYGEPRTVIPAERWPEVREHARRSGLRATARTFGVSHEALRQIVLCGQAAVTH